MTQTRTKTLAIVGAVIAAAAIGGLFFWKKYCTKNPQACGSGQSQSVNRPSDDKKGSDDQRGGAMQIIEFPHKNR